MRSADKKKKKKKLTALSKVKIALSKGKVQSLNW